MLINLEALLKEMPILAGVSTNDLCLELASLGFPVDEVKTIDNTVVLDVDITSNRGDAQSHRGIARDLAAKLNVTLGPIPYVATVEGEPLLVVHLEAPEVAPVYSTAILNLDLSGTNIMPDMVKNFLASINVDIKELLAVDVSNEILHLYGQPTHAFDADLIRGEISVRWAQDGETLITLDMIERKLSSRDLIIADDTGPISMAGLIGGNKTKVSSNTRRVLLESAFFDSRTVRAMSCRHNLHTDASQHFGRGTDPKFVIAARDILVNRLKDWGGAKLCSSWTVGSIPLETTEVYLPWNLLDQVAGYRINHSECISMLQRLGCSVYEVDDKLVVKTPSWRHDLTIAVDLVEEILRLKGYEVVPLELPQVRSLPVQLNSDYIKRRKLASHLANLGFFQTVTMGFVDPKDSCCSSDNYDLRALRNPLGEHYSVMRDSLLPDLTRIAKLNLERGLKEARFFEIAPVFQAYPGRPIEEIWTLGIIWAGVSGGNDPLSAVRDISKSEGQSFLIGILKSIGVTDDFIQSFNNWQMISSKGSFNERLGWQFEVPLSAILSQSEELLPKFTPFSRFPAMERDLSLIVDLNQSYNLLRNAIVAAMNNIGAPLQDLRCVDVFRHKDLPFGRQAWLLRLYFQAIDHTLTREDVDNWMDLAITTAKLFGAELRG